MPNDRPNLLSRLFGGDSSTKSYNNLNRTVNPVTSWFQGWTRNYDPQFFEPSDDGLQRAYLASLWAYRCISLRGKRLAAVPLLVKSHDDQYPDRYGMLHDEPVSRKVRQHILQRFVGPGSTRVWRTLEYDMCIWGRGFILPTQRGLFRLNPSTIEVLKSAENGIDGFRQIIAGNTVNEWEPDELIYFYDYDPTDDVGSIAPLAFALSQVGAEVSVSEFVNGFFANDATPAGLLSSDQPLKQQDIDFTMKWWNKLFGGIGNAGKIGIVGGGLKFQQISSSMEDLAIPALRLEIRRDVCAAFGVPMTIALADEAANFATAGQQYVAFYTETILPELDLILDTLNEQLVPRFDRTGSLKIEADTAKIKPLQEDAGELTNRAVAGFGGTVMTFNESRKIQDLSPAADDYINVANVGIIRVDDLPILASRNLQAALGETSKGDPIPERQAQADALVDQSKPPSGGGGPDGASPQPSPLSTIGPVVALDNLTDNWMEGSIDRARATEHEANQPDKGEPPDDDGPGPAGGGGQPRPPQRPSPPRQSPPQLVIPIESRPTGMRWEMGGHRTKSAPPEGEMYVSIPLPGHPAVRALQDHLKQQLGDALDIQTPDTLHVTLCYATGVPDDAMAKIVHGVKPLAVMLRGGRLGLFPANPDRPEEGRALHIALNPTSSLREFQRRVYEAVQPHGSISPYSEPTAYTPHITLGYLPADTTFAPPAAPFALGIPVSKVEFSRPGYNVVGELLADQTTVEPSPPVIQKSLALAELKQWRKKAIGKGAHKSFSSLAIPSAIKMFLQWDLADAGDDPTAIKSAFDKAVHTLESKDPTPEEFQEYWEGLDDISLDLVDKLGGMLEDPELLKTLADKIEQTGSVESVNTFFDDRTQAMVDQLVGTEQAPGPLTQIFLAGAVRGQKIHDRLAGAIQRASKAAPTTVDISSAWDLLHKNARQTARTYAYDLVRGMNDNTRTAFQNAVANWISFGGSLPHLTDYLHGRLKGLDIPEGWDDKKIKWATSRDRARTIAQTESTRVFTQGNVARWQQAGVQLIQWKTQNDRDVCGLCKALGKMTPADPNKGFPVPPEYQAKYGLFIQQPPGHVGCRCFPQPAHIVFAEEPKVIQPSAQGLKPKPVSDMTAAQSDQKPEAFTVFRVYPDGREEAAGRRDSREADAILRATRLQGEADGDPQLVGLRYKVVSSATGTTFTPPSTPRVAYNPDGLVEDMGEEY